jgi:hypothetical protein
MVLWHILAMLCKMFTITPIVTDRQVKEDPWHSLHARQIWILWIFTCGDSWNPLYIQILLPTRRHFTIVLWKPVRLSAATTASLNECSSPWWDMLMWTLNLMEDILSIYYKYTLSAVTHKWNFSRHMLMWTFFLLLVRGTCAQSLFALSVYTLYSDTMWSHWIING